MKTTKFFKQVIVIMVIAIMVLMTNTGVANAVLQSNPNVQYNKATTPTNWISTFRQMETAGGGMGLNETLNEDLTASSESNNIDVHMVRTTEYGAMAILSASGYGNPSNDRVITSSTGNNTGVIINTGNEEFTAGGIVDVVFPGINGRYFDTYISVDATSSRIGDGLGDATTPNPGCTKWHSATNSAFASTGVPYFSRGAGGIFAYSQGRRLGSLQSWSSRMRCWILKIPKIDGSFLR